MGEPVAKRGDRVVGSDKHWELNPSGASPPTLEDHSFSGPLSDNLSSSVFVGNEPAAILGSTANNRPSHIPARYPFQTAPSNRASISGASSTVYAGDQPIARNNDAATSCSDDGAQNNGHVIASGDVVSG